MGEYLSYTLADSKEKKSLSSTSNVLALLKFANDKISILYFMIHIAIWRASKEKRGSLLQTLWRSLLC